MEAKKQNKTLLANLRKQKRERNKAKKRRFRQVKRALLSVSLLATVMPAYADLTPVEKGCENLSTLSAAIMAARQHNARMSQVISHLDHSNAAMEKMQRRFVQAAYDEPRYHTKAKRKQASRNFENKVYSACLDHFEDRK